MRFILSALALLLLLAQWRLWVSDDGLREARRLERAVEAQRLENEELAERNAALRAEVGNLRDGLEAAEERARADLGMIREDETFYQLVPVPGSAAGRR
jgi:cell division protein FtsB